MSDSEVQKASKLSGYLIHAQQKSEQIQKRANAIKYKIAREFDNPPKHISDAQEIIDHLIKTFEASRKTSETWIYVDMDMFFASIEIRDNPVYSDKPVAVSNSSVVSSANYIARRFGVKSSMPEFQAEKLCPEIIFVPQNLSKYKEENEKIKAIFKEYDPNYEDFGLDEAGLHVTNVLKRRFADTDTGREALASEIRQKIFMRTQLTCSAGIACNKMLAKMCSKVNKPNGQFYLKPESIKEYMKNVDIGNVSGITRNEAQVLKLIGVHTCGDALKKRLDLYFGLNQILLSNVLKCALGLGPTEHDENHSQIKKSINASKSFEPTNKVDILENKLAEVTDMIDLEMKKKKVKGKGIEVGVKTYCYDLKTRREVTRKYFTNGNEVNDIALTLLRMFYPIEEIRNIAVRIYLLKPFNGKVPQKKIVEKKNKYPTTEFEVLFMNSSMKPPKSNDTGLNSQAVRNFRYLCDHCGKWLTGTDTQMQSHLKTCTGYINYKPNK